MSFWNERLIAPMLITMLMPTIKAATVSEVRPRERWMFPAPIAPSRPKTRTMAGRTNFSSTSMAAGTVSVAPSSITNTARLPT